MVLRLGAGVAQLGRVRALIRRDVSRQRSSQAGMGVLLSKMGLSLSEALWSLSEALWSLSEVVWSRSSEDNAAGSSMLPCCS